MTLENLLDKPAANDDFYHELEVRNYLLETYTTNLATAIRKNKNQKIDSEQLSGTLLPMYGLSAKKYRELADSQTPQEKKGELVEILEKDPLHIYLKRQDDVVTKLTQKAKIKGIENLVTKDRYDAIKETFEVEDYLVHISNGVSGLYNQMIGSFMLENKDVTEDQLKAVNQNLLGFLDIYFNNLVEEAKNIYGEAKVDNILNKAANNKTYLLEDKEAA